MKVSLSCLLCWLVVTGAHAQYLVAPTPSNDFNALYPTLKSVFLPLAGLYLLCQLVITLVQLLTAYSLKKQILSATVPENVVTQLIPGPQDERNSVIRRIALLTSTGVGLVFSNWALPWGINSIVILLFSTAAGYLSYYLYLVRQAK
jgi:hypothetical protein